MQLLDAHVAQRGGIDPRNYGSWKDYRAESRSVTADRRNYERIASAVRWRSFTLAQWQDAFRGAFSGRLSLTERRGGWKLEYCTGGYFPTEYRKAACAVLASLLWADARENMPVKDDGSAYQTYGGGMSAGDYLRRNFYRQFGRTIAKGYFS